MAIVTDPDNLDRWNVIVNPTAGVETISIRGLDAERTTASANDGTSEVGTTFSSDDGGIDFSTDVAAGDILCIVNGADAGHHIVASVTDANNIELTEALTAVATDLSFRIYSPKAQGGTSENVSDGVTMQALYSFLKEEWRDLDTTALSGTNAPDLIKFIFPLESITREQFEIGGPTHSDWDFADNTTRQLLRTGGWAQISVGGTTQSEYAGIITLGSVDSDAQVYYQQVDANQAPTDFVLTGPVNQAILTYDGTNDYRTYLKLFVRKKARTYAQSEIADIGVTAIETIVNRFPLAHVTDPAITTDDGNLITDSPWTTAVATVNSGVSGAGEGITDPTSGDGLFTFEDADAGFDSSNEVFAGDAITFTSGNLSGNTYEIASITDGTTIVIFEEPLDGTIAAENAVNYTTKTRYIGSFVPGYITDAVNADAVADDGTGEITSSTGASWSGVAAGDMVRITNGGTAGTSIVGIYKILGVDGTTLNVDILDNENWATGTGISLEIVEPGMYLQQKTVTATEVTAGGSHGTFTFDSTNQTLTMSSGDLTTETVPYEVGMSITIAGTTSNDGTYTIETVTATVITIAETGTSGFTDEGPVATTATLNGDGGFYRSLGGTYYSFHWRLFGNNGTLSNAFEFIQRELRRATDIDEATAASRGDVTDLLMTYASPTGVGLDMYIDDLASADFNNVTFNDVLGNSRNYPFVAGVTITLNDNLINSTDCKVTVFFTNDDAGDNTGRDFGTANAIIVKDSTNNDMVAINPSADLEYTYDYDFNDQRGTSSKATIVPITIVAIGTDTAQYVKTTGNIQRQNQNTFALVSSLERNYSNP